MHDNASEPIPADGTASFDPCAVARDGNFDQDPSVRSESAVVRHIEFARDAEPKPPRSSYACPFHDCDPMIFLGELHSISARLFWLWLLLVGVTVLNTIFFVLVLYFMYAPYILPATPTN